MDDGESSAEFEVCHEHQGIAQDVVFRGWL